MQRLAVRSLYDHSQEESLRGAFVKEGVSVPLKLYRVYWLLERQAGLFKELDLDHLRRRVFCDAISEEMRVDFLSFKKAHTYVEIRFRAGVTDNLARSATEALMLFSPSSPVAWQDFGIEVHSGWELEMAGDISQQHIEKVLFQTLANPLLHQVHCLPGEKLVQENPWSDFRNFWQTPQQDQKSLRLFDLDKGLLHKVNQERGLALSDDEIETIIRHFSSPQMAEQRRRQGWQGQITEVELECLAQTWSEHCKHKIFAAEVDYSEDKGAFPPVGNKTITSLYKSYIQKATKDLSSSCDYLVSVFKDNAGIVDFDKNLNVCVKVETHNSPSALDPFGGAITGILGVNRDILGCGLGAKPVANTDVFCLSTPQLFPQADSPRRPEILKDPGVIFRGVHQGVEEGGNQSGIPTVNGAFHFASEFAAKPLIFVGSLGVMPKKIQGRPSEEKKIHPGDIIVVAGGRLGKDGVHGATFSSLALHDEVSPNVVQIGDSITQKRLLDFTLRARDRGLIQAITDNGAGGVSSSIGEMAQLSGGARMDLERHPVKYKGLEYWEMLVSESQERMSYAVRPENLQNFLSLATELGVEASALGEFTDHGHFDVYYGDKLLASLELHFLHEGLSRMKLQAHFSGPQDYQEFYRQSPRQKITVGDSQALPTVLRRVMASPNVASRESLVRYYDHEVQAATRVKPYGGSSQQGANDAGVLDLEVHGGEKGNAVAVANGLCPQFSYYDTYLMAQKAVDEAIRNLVATGADPQRLALVDNFCWPDPTPKESNPDAAHKMAQLVRACEGLYTAAMVFKAPLVSGKDSMKNDFIGKTQNGETIKISVPPTLLMTAIGQMPDSSKGAPGYFQRPDEEIYVLGSWTESLYGSVYAQEFEAELTAPEYPQLAENKALYEKIHQAHQQQLLSSCHDISDGGLMSALVESCFGESLGMTLDLSSLTWNNLWSETGSQFVVSVKSQHLVAFEELFAGRFTHLGRTQKDFTMKWKFKGQDANLKLAELRDIWSQGVLNVYET